MVMVVMVVVMVSETQNRVDEIEIALDDSLTMHGGRRYEDVADFGEIGRDLCRIPNQINLVGF